MTCTGSHSTFKSAKFTMNFRRMFIVINRLESWKPLIGNKGRISFFDRATKMKHRSINKDNQNDIEDGGTHRHDHNVLEKQEQTSEDADRLVYEVVDWRYWRYEVVG